MGRHTRPRGVGREPLPPLRWNPPPTRPDPRPPITHYETEEPEPEFIVTTDGRVLRRVVIEQSQNAQGVTQR